MLVYAHANNVEPFLEPVLELSDAIIARDAAHLGAGTSQGELLGAFLQQLPVFMDLCTHPEPPVSVAASTCLSMLVRPGAAVWLHHAMMPLYIILIMS